MAEHAGPDDAARLMLVFFAERLALAKKGGGGCVIAAEFDRETHEVALYCDRCQKRTAYGKVGLEETERLAKAHSDIHDLSDMGALN